MQCLRWLERQGSGWHWQRLVGFSIAGSHTEVSVELQESQDHSGSRAGMVLGPADMQAMHHEWKVSRGRLLSAAEGCCSVACSVPGRVSDQSRRGWLMQQGAPGPSKMLRLSRRLQIIAGEPQ